MVLSISRACGSGVWAYAFEGDPELQAAQEHMPHSSNHLFTQTPRDAISSGIMDTFQLSLMKLELSADRITRLLNERPHDDCSSSRARLYFYLFSLVSARCVLFDPFRLNWITHYLTNGSISSERVCLLTKTKEGLIEFQRSNFYLRKQLSVWITFRERAELIRTCTEQCQKPVLRFEKRTMRCRETSI